MHVSFLLSTLLATTTATPEPPPPSARAVARAVEGIGVDERLGARAPRDVTFTDEQGMPFAVAGRGRPQLLTFNYARCPMLCSLQLAGLALGLKELPVDGVPDFDVLTVGLDPTEKPGEAMRAKQIYVRQAGGSARVGNAWHFLRGEHDEVARLAAAVGFRYRYDAASREYLHPATLIVLTPDGRVSRYLHGISFAPADLRDALIAAARGDVLTPVAQTGLRGFLLQCIRYDGAGHPPLAVWVMRGGGLVVLAGLAALLLSLVRDSRRRKPPVAQET